MTAVCSGISLFMLALSSAIHLLGLIKLPRRLVNEIAIYVIPLVKYYFRFWISSLTLNIRFSPFCDILC